MSPAVSVILPTYNRAHTLARALDSLLAQTFGDFEVVVVDDGSTDATAGVLGRYASDPRVRVLARAHAGAAAARNAGLRAARGRYLAFHDSDDECAPHKLATAVASLDAAGPDCAAFYSDMWRVTADGRALPMPAPDLRGAPLIDERTLEFSVGPIGLGAAVFRRECFARVGLLDEEMPRLIDVEFFLRLFPHYTFHHHAEPLVRYHAGPGISTDRRALVVARLRLLGKYGPLLRRRRHVAGQLLHVASACWWAGDLRAAGAYARRALLKCPTHPLVLRRSLLLIQSSLRGRLAGSGTAGQRQVGEPAGAAEECSRGVNPESGAA